MPKQLEKLVTSNWRGCKRWGTRGGNRRDENSRVKLPKRGNGPFGGTETRTAFLKGGEQKGKGTMLNPHTSSMEYLDGARGK